MPRDYQNFFGLSKPDLIDPASEIAIPNAFIVISEIEILSWRIGWVYEVFWSTNAFNAELQSIKNLQRNFWVEGVELTGLKSEKESFFSLFDQRCRSLVLPLPSENAEFERATFRTLGYSLDINYQDNGKVPRCELKVPEYHLAIENNLDLVGFDGQGNPGLLPILHSISAIKDPIFFADTTLILPE